MRLHCGQKCSSTGAPAPQLRHSSIDDERTGIGSGVMGSWQRQLAGLPTWLLPLPAAAAARHAPKELPQPQVCFAFGLLNTKPCVSSAVS